MGEIRARLTRYDVDEEAHCRHVRARLLQVQVQGQAGTVIGPGPDGSRVKAWKRVSEDRDLESRSILLW